MRILHQKGEKGYSSLADKKFDYRYPSELDLRPGSPDHERLVKEITRRAQESYDVMSRRHSDWNKIDKTLTAYIYSDDEELEVQEDDERKPISVVVPHSYAILETLLTYWTSIFLDLPYFRYEATSGNPVSAIMLEKVVEQQCVRNKIGLNLYTMGRDSFAYGFGAVTPTWHQRWGYKTERDAAGVRTRRKQVLFEGNRVDNIDPYLYLPDPSVPIHEPQRGEFVGWIERTNYMSLLNDESTEGTSLFNCQYLKFIDGRSTIVSTDESNREYKFGGSGRDTMTEDSTHPMDVIWMYILLVPSDEEWKLSSSQYPEKWLFGLAGDQVLIAAEPINLDHDQYPVAISAPDFDGYSLCPISKLEVNHGLQHFLDFLLNSHMTNIRKAINDMLIVDPYLINMNDLRKPGPGKLVRTRRAAWGKGVQNAVMQLSVNDITRNHMADAGIVMDIMQRSSSASDALQGIVRKGSERRSATEYRDTRMGALSRMARAAKIASIMGLYDLAYMIASQTQQLMNQSIYVNFYGRHQEELQAEYGEQVTGMAITPDMISLDYGVLPHDGTMELGEYAETWTNLYQILATNPAIGRGFDMVRIFKHIARMLGAKNVNDFVQKGGNLKIKTAQDEEVLDEVAAGNLIALGE